MGMPEDKKEKQEGRKTEKNPQWVTQNGFFTKPILTCPVYQHSICFGGRIKFVSRQHAIGSQTRHRGMNYSSTLTVKEK